MCTRVPPRLAKLFTPLRRGSNPAERRRACSSGHSAVGGKADLRHPAFAILGVTGHRASLGAGRGKCTLRNVRFFVVRFVLARLAFSHSGD